MVSIDPLNFITEYCIGSGCIIQEMNSDDCKTFLYPVRVWHPTVLTRNIRARTVFRDDFDSWDSQPWIVEVTAWGGGVK